MRYLQTYEFYLTDLENYNMIKNPKYLYIIEWYLAQIDDENYNSLELNIPVDIWYEYEHYTHRDSGFTKEKRGNDNRHFDKIVAMWMSLKNQHFKEYHESPYFLIEIQGDISDKKSRIAAGEDKDRFIIRDKRSNDLIIDAIYKYAHDEHGEIYSAKKYNL